MTPDPILRAVGACTRALSGSEAAATVVAAATALTQVTAATLSGLRAAGDRLAIGARHHDARLHQRHAPPDMPASSIFEALERGRLDAIGVGWLSGVAKNLMAHPGADSDGVRWLAFESVSDRPAPVEKTTLVDLVRAALP
jgi:cobalamin biosynthesis protein CobT